MTFAKVKVVVMIEVVDDMVVAGFLIMVKLI
jgi:hypothetical protein